VAEYVGVSYFIQVSLSAAIALHQYKQSQRIRLSTDTLFFVEIPYYRAKSRFPPSSTTDSKHHKPNKHTMTLANTRRSLCLSQLLAVIGITVVEGQVPPVPRSICYDTGFTNAEAEIFCKEAYSDVDKTECAESDLDFSAGQVYNKDCIMRCDDDEFICSQYGMTCYSDLGCLIPYTTTYEGSGI